MNETTSKHIVHIITDLNQGGAEMALYKLLSAFKSPDFKHSVISLRGTHLIGEQIKELGVSVTALGMEFNFSIPGVIRKLALQLKQLNPDIVQTWMHHANLIGGVVAKAVSNPVIFWCIHDEPSKRKKRPYLTKIIIKTCKNLSVSIPDKIIYVSRKAKDAYTHIGYANDKAFCISNGFDLTYLTQNQNTRMELRREFKIPDGAIVIGNIGRYHQDKDYPNLIKSVSSLVGCGYNIYLLLCGKNLVLENNELNELIQQHNLQDKVMLLGLRTDIPRVMSAMDIFCLSSATEAFPNVIGEAMACSRVCVATMVGDTEFILGDTGIIVPPGQSELLAAGLKTVIELSNETRVEMGRKARLRIQNNFDIDYVARQYEDFYREATYNARNSRVN